jgi:PPOX class probable F420-dependent enzyme
MASAALSTDAIQRFLLAKSVAVLATIQASGAPLATPMWFVHDDQSIIMISEKGLQKVTNLRRDPRACVTVEGEVNGETAGVIVQGQIRFLDAATERAPHVDALHAKYHGALAGRWGGRAMLSDRVMFCLEAYRVNAWGLG